jgi:DNA polymerase-3 subunit gamma/tau
MASQSLYRKWRSQTFSDLVGQEPVIRTLKNALKDGKLAHAYLFTGPRGTGKTSTARLLAKTINCLHSINDEPCNECQQCREITAGNSFNVMEIDAASNRGIDSIRELREKVMVPPSTGKYKVYILDEAHMLTVEAFNALLKTLEEPPPHTIFVMATTDVHKMLPTVLSRCQRFDFKRITTRQIVEHLCFVAEQEQVQLERGAAELIARAAAGGMRDALSLLDQAIAYAGHVIALSQVQAMLGVADPRAIQKFIVHIANLDGSAGLHLIHELSEAGADLRQINNQVAEYWRAMMLCSAGANIGEILDSTEDEVREITETARLFALEELIECSRIFAQNDLMQKNQGTPQLGLELALLSCVELHRRAQAGQPLIASSSALPARSQPSSVPPRAASPQPQTPRVTPPLETRVSPPPAPVQPSSVIKESSRVSDQEPNPFSLNDGDGEVSFSSPSSADEVQPLQHPPVPPSTPVSDEQFVNDPPTVTVAEVKEKWEYVKRRVRTKKDGAKVSALLNGFTVVSVEGTSTQLIIAIKATAEFHYRTIHKNEEHQKLIEWALKIELGQECHVRLLSSTQSVPLPSLPRNPENGNGSAPPPPSSLPRNSGGGSATLTMPQVAPTLMAPSLERPLSVQPPVSSRSDGLLLPATQRPTASVFSSPAPGSVSPLARTGSVRENSKATSSSPDGKTRSGETRQAQVEKKAKADPVVQETLRVFKAQIKEIHLK